MKGLIMPVEALIRQRAVRPLERMNSPLEHRKVRLRGLGGHAVCGLQGIGASATGDYRISFSKGIIGETFLCGAAEQDGNAAKANCR